MELIQGKCDDIYYANPETTLKSCIPTKVTTKYTQAIQSLNGGTSTFTIPPNFGLQGIAIQLQLPQAAGGAAANLALARGWCYSAIKQISYRVGGSTQFFCSGAQMLQHNLKRMTNQQAKDDLFALGGSYITGAGFEVLTNRGYAFLDVPWCKATSEGMPVPLPSDILGSQVQITLELFPLSDLIAVNSTGTIPANFGLGFNSGSFQVQQLLMSSRDDSLATRENLAVTQYVMPVEFVQQEQVVPCANTTAVQTITATGFRAGSVKSIECWITDDADDGLTKRNKLKWYIPQNLQCSYAGDVYARFDNGISQLWNLVNGKSSPYVNGLTIGYSGGYTTTTEQYGWATLPFAQTYDSADSSSFMLVEGLNVTNGIVSIQFSHPSINSANWKFHLSYIYNASAVFSQSSCEFVF
jgi:hypothetical protein